MKTQLTTAIAALFVPLQGDLCFQSPDWLLVANIVPLQSVCIVHTMRREPTL